MGNCLRKGLGRTQTSVQARVCGRVQLRVWARFRLGLGRVWARIQARLRQGLGKHLEKGLSKGSGKGLG